MNTTFVTTRLSATLAAAIVVSSAVNVWLTFQNIRLVTYGFRFTMSEMIPLINPYARLDPILELPAIVIAVAVAYVLLYQHAFHIWRYKYSIIRKVLITRAVKLNGILILILAVAGSVQWFIQGFIMWDWLIPSIIGAIAAAIAYLLEKKVSVAFTRPHIISWRYWWNKLVR